MDCKYSEGKFCRTVQNMYRTGQTETLTVNNCVDIAKCSSSSVRVRNVTIIGLLEAPVAWLHLGRTRAR